MTRLEFLVGDHLGQFENWAHVASPDPELALVGLERWLAATTNPATQVQVLVDHPRLGQLIMTMLGSSQRIADGFIQNPEFASWLTDPDFMGLVPDRTEIEFEGRQLLSVASGYTHKLDRLRFLRQSWMTRITLNDLAETWAQPQVWRALSDLADAILSLTHEVVWQEYSGLKGIHESCPVSIIAFGKLGGHEVNYSSDVDLVYVCADGTSDGLEKHAGRFAEMFGRALSDAMGRGALYRVDMRLRPYGSAGSLVPTLKAVEAYYRSYAEEWEYQALIRSRAVVADLEMSERWNHLRNQHCFRPQLATSAVEQMLNMRVRIEQTFDENDLKRASGGIRDVEFYVQILQRIHGHDHPEVRERATLDALEGLFRIGIVSGEIRDTLGVGYAFLRQLEHRLQLGDQQNHSLPNNHDELLRLARLMGLISPEELLAKVGSIRSSIRTIYQAGIPELNRISAREHILNSVGDLRDRLAAWIDALPESDAYYQAIAENASSLNRLSRILDNAPRASDILRASVGLSESAISGEIEEPIEPELMFESGGNSASTAMLGGMARMCWGTIGSQVALGIVDPKSVSHWLTRVSHSFLSSSLRSLNPHFDVLGLGSFGLGEVNFGSDLDLVLLVKNSELSSLAEEQAQKWIESLTAARVSGSPVSIDLRLRPDGQKGTLVRSYDSFRLYELTGMAMWERFALGSSTLVYGQSDALDLALWAAYSQPLTPERLDELLKMKQRIETERVEPKHGRRHVKLGIGGLSDLEWFVRLHEMRYPTATDALQSRTLVERLSALNRARLIHTLEHQSLLEAHDHLCALRAQLWLFGFTPDIVPENPDRLERLAKAFGETDPNLFLSRHDEVIDRVRSIYNEGLERLRA